MPLSQSASGKVLLSRMPEEVAQQALENEKHYGSSSTGARKSLLKTLDSIREKGYLITRASNRVRNGYGGAGGRCQYRHVGGGHCAVYFTGTVAKSSKTYLKSVLKCANRINRNLGISP